ncbi:MAG TPA: hypothetical protein VEH04_13630 [Verrucomicrobiae bacterium]|nr:hypothetical protein [Verrucomicrobiae bacterium]
MKTLCACVITVLVLVLTSGCGKHEHSAGDGHDHGEHDHSAADDADGHVHGGDRSEPAAGADFHRDRGVVLSDATRESIGLRTASVVLRTMPREIRFTVQLFGEHHRHQVVENDHSGCDVHGSALLPMEMTNQVRVGQAVELLQLTNASPPGVVLNAHQALALGELELVVGFSNAATTLRPGDFLPARIRTARERPVLAVPQPAVLRIAEGTFVYVETGGAFQRRKVLVGSESDGWSEIISGVREGEVVVIEPVHTLWLVELRATRGGGHSH